MMEVILLSQYPEFLEETADLLNSEWKRSASARLQSLENSSINLPDSLLLIETNEKGKTVIGHSRLMKILECHTGCWIGSVVIRKDKRKKGYGKYLMQKTEEYAKVLQFRTAFLNTRDQQGFYEHLGYEYCHPVSPINFQWRTPGNIFWCSTEYEIKNNLNGINYKSHVKECHEDVNQKEIVPAAPPPPPPPPPLLPSSKITLVNNNTWSNLGQHWMKKTLL